MLKFLPIVNSFIKEYSMEKNDIFPVRLADAINMRGVTQKWLAEHAYTTEATISRYIKSVNSPAILTILADIASALNVSSDYLLGLTNIPNAKETIPEEFRILASCVNRASEDDKRVLWTLMSKYLTSEERKTLGI